MGQVVGVSKVDQAREVLGTIRDAMAKLESIRCANEDHVVQDRKHDLGAVLLNCESRARGFVESLL